MAPLAPGSLIVIVGITGYIASHIGLEALQAGYRVRGTARSISKADELKAVYQKKGVDLSKLEIVELDDLLSEQQFEAAFSGADGVIHPARPDRRDAGALDEMIESTMIPLKVAAKVGIKRVVLTGTAGTVTGGIKGKAGTFTDKDWNDESVIAYRNATDEEKKSPQFFAVTYLAGKTLALREAFKYMETHSPPFDLTVTLPSLTWGPRVGGGPPRSARWLVDFVKGDGTAAQSSNPPLYYVDVRDAAKLHVISLHAPEVVGKRIFACAHPFGWGQVLDILRKRFPDAHIPPNPPPSPVDPCPWRIENSLSTKLLGGKWIELEKCIFDTFSEDKP